MLDAPKASTNQKRFPVTQGHVGGSLRSANHAQTLALVQGQNAHVCLRNSNPFSWPPAQVLLDEVTFISSVLVDDPVISFLQERCST
eukprot:scaffold4058_cov257-Pinguiococcus_pyrenoidosus.AAC.12